MRYALRSWRWFDAAEIGLGLVIVVAAAAVADFSIRQGAIVNPGPVFLIAVLLSASIFGVRAAIVSALFAFFLFNFFLVEPRYTFRLASPDDFLSLLVFLAVALITGYFAGQAHDQARRARERAQVMGALFEAGSTMAASASARDIAEAAARAGEHLAATPVSVLFRTDDAGAAADAALPVLAHAGDTAAPRLTTRDVGRFSATHTGDWSAWRLDGAQGLVGALVAASPGKSADPDTARALSVLAQLTATALERAALQGEVSQARLLAESERLRAALLDSVSHDFRTPLAGILAASTSLVQDGESFDAATRRALAETIQAYAERLASYTRNLLDMTRIDGGAVRARLDWLDVSEALGAVASRSRRPHAHVQIEIARQTGPWQVLADDMLLEQALMNYVDNAAEWTPQGGQVTLSAAPARAGFGVYVDDEGPGVAADDLPRVFEKHYRGAGAAQQRLGPGLGLSIVRGFAEAMGAAVVAQSPAPSGRGARFGLVFPAASVRLAP